MAKDFIFEIITQLFILIASVSPKSITLFLVIVPGQLFHRLISRTSGSGGPTHRLWVALHIDEEGRVESS